MKNHVEICCLPTKYTEDIEYINSKEFECKDQIDGWRNHLYDVKTVQTCLKKLQKAELQYMIAKKRHEQMESEMTGKIECAAQNVKELQLEYDRLKNLKENLHVQC
jgi:hypothetical protein